MSNKTDQAFSVAANAKSTDQMVGHEDAYLQGPAILRLYCTSSAVGLRVSLFVGTRILLDDQLMSSANRFPIIPDDLLVDDAGLAGQQVRLFFRNGTAGALTTDYNFVIKYV